MTSLGAVCGNIAGIFGPVADVSSNMDLYTQEFVDMNAAFPGNAPFLETVQPEFHRFTRSPKVAPANV